MSFILDALKKSESDRQRRNGPALFEVRVTPPRSRLAPWAIAIVLLLAVNLGIVAWMLARRPAREAGAPGAALPAVPVAPPPAAATAPAPAAAPGAVSSAAAPVAAAGPPAVAAAVAPAPAVAPAAAQAARGAAEETNPEDFAPAEAPAAPEPSTHVRRGTAEGVPLYQDAAAAGGKPIPSLHLDLHVYAERPSDRFVMINMHKLREGEALPDGVRVEAITPDGAVLSYNGSRFLITQ